MQDTDNSLTPDAVFKLQWSIEEVEVTYGKRKLK